MCVCRNVCVVQGGAEHAVRPGLLCVNMCVRVSVAHETQLERSRADEFRDQEDRKETIPSLFLLAPPLCSSMTTTPLSPPLPLPPPFSLWL